MRITDTYILDAIEDLLKLPIPSADQDRWVYQAKVDRLHDVVRLARANNSKATDRKYLTKTALETQEACNPRPVSVLLTNALYLEGASGGNPAMSKSPLVRLFLNTLLNTLGPFHELPAYTADHMLYSEDCKALEKSLEEPNTAPVAST